ncbi:SDR family NAD(P)-dependent oxidoreductase [Nocardia sp. NPDC005366]|uniref:SDR family oxidoreductase n=1 Tax=Nocardia sp. NPDC005366 TaxID=3156878 RepID=UPI0033BCA502
MNKIKYGVAFVTGGASGIGQALCQEIVRRGGKVAVADIEQDKAESLAKELRAVGGEAIAVHCDVTSRESVEAAYSSTVQTFGKVNLVCANAGVIVPGPVAKTRESDMLWMYEVNVFGTLRTIQTFLPALDEAHGRGEFAHLLLTGSENSLGVPIVGPCSVYTSTKHALLGLADTLRRDLLASESGVGVTLVCPAVVNTQIWNATRNRPNSLGGPRQINSAASEMFSQSNTPESVAIIGLDGCDAAEFLVIPHPEVESFTRRRADDLNRAMDACLDRVSSLDHSDTAVTSARHGGVNQEVHPQ